MTSRRNDGEPSAQHSSNLVPAYRRLYEEIRTAILTGQLAGGARLPATRQLATEKGVSRNTVLAAFDQLHAEGYVVARSGSGTFVARVLPERMLRTRSAPFARRDPPASRPALSARGAALTAAPRMPLPGFTGSSPDRPAFQIGLPALKEFPSETWARLYGARVRLAAHNLMRYDDPAGYLPLREQIAANVATSRGIRCSPEQVVIVAGSQQALEFSARILLDPGTPAWIEDPCYLGAKAALLSAGARIVPVPADDQGLVVEAGIEREPNARLVVVTPSHQFPMGITMSLERRLALIDWAQRCGAWIVEDDYDNEFRYRGRPVAALRAIDPHERVIYVGTFSKTMFPGMRLGYVIAPPDLVDGFAAAHLSTDMHAHLLDQAVMTDFLAGGHYARHVRRMRILYGERQRRLIAAAHRTGGTLQTDTPGGGLHLVAWLPRTVDDAAAADAALDAGVHALPLSLHVIERRRPPALLLGYAGTPDTEIAPAMQRLSEAIRRIAT